jgi:X box-binding protein 1
MSVLQPKTIILAATQPLRTIQTVGGYGTPLLLGKRPESNMTAVDLESLMDDKSVISDDDSLSCDAPRKRKRLNYLSVEEKLVRRKLKNRVAAQTARDRKKQRMTELEDALAELQAVNQSLVAENDELRRSANSLLHENTQLKQRLELVPTATDPSTTESVKEQLALVTRKTSDVEMTESAELIISPQQREQEARTTFQLATYCITLLALLSLIHGSNRTNSSYKFRRSSTKCMTVAAVTAAMTDGYHCYQPIKYKQRPPREWWGRPQHLTSSPSLT